MQSWVLWGQRGNITALGADARATRGCLCNHFVTRLSPRHCWIGSSASPAQLPFQTTWAFLSWPLGRDVTPSVEMAQQPAQWPVSAATINGSSTRNNHPILCFRKERLKAHNDYRRATERLLSRGTQSGLISPHCHVHLCQIDCS